jgi:hypothetical protein
LVLGFVIEDIFLPTTYLLIMKQLILFFAFSCLFCNLNAQLPKVLDHLDGRWYVDNAPATVFSEWSFVNNNEATGTIVSKQGNETIVLATFKAVFTHENETLLYLQERAMAVQIFRMISATDCAVVWQNTISSQLPTCLTFDFPKRNSMAYKGLEQSFEFKREKIGHFTAGLSLGIGATRSIAHTPKVYKDAYISIHTQREYQMGSELGIGINIAHTHSPFNIRLEAGYGSMLFQDTKTSQRPYSSETTTVKSVQTQFFYSGIYPEARFGAKRRFGVFGGFSMIHSPKEEHTIIATTDLSMANEVGTSSLRQDLKSNIRFGASFGVSYRLPLIARAIEPEFYAKVSHVRFVSCGMLFAIGSR